MYVLLYLQLHRYVHMLLHANGWFHRHSSFYQMYEHVIPNYSLLIQRQAQSLQEGKMYCSVSWIPPLSVHLSTNYLYQVKVFLSMLTIYPTNIDHTTYLLKSGKF